MTKKINHKAQNYAIIVVAAGVGARMGGDKPKQYQEVNGVPMLTRSVAVLRDALPDAQLIVVIHPEHEEYAKLALSSFQRKLESTNLDVLDSSFRWNDKKSDGKDEKGFLYLIHGGATRAQSVLLGLRALAMLPTPPKAVLVHDAARPFVSLALIERLLATANDHPTSCIIPALAVVDTLKEIEGETVVATLPRDSVRRVQTPQLAPFSVLLAAHEALFEAGTLDGCTDDASVMAAYGHPVVWVKGEESNRKMTMKHDFETVMGGKQSFAPRVGMGYDVHPFETHNATTPLGQQVITLGGVAIPFERKLKGHSDADVVLHALVDALLGAIGAGDIGLHFPPSDARWKDADSADFVREAVRLIEERGGRIENVDVTYIGEVPKIGIYREAMQARIADILGVSPPRVNVKATTTEKLGFTGREEGAAAQAVALVMLPSRF